MKNIVKKISFIALSAGLLSFAMFAFNASDVKAQTNIENGVCAGVNFDPAASETCNPATTKVEAENSVNTIIKTVINIFSLVVGVVSVIMIMVGGLRYITSSGDAGNTKAAKDTILYAIIGLVVVVLAQVIVRFVLGRVTQPATTTTSYVLDIDSIT